MLTKSKDFVIELPKKTERGSKNEKNFRFADFGFLNDSLCRR